MFESKFEQHCESCFKTDLVNDKGNAITHRIHALAEIDKEYNALRKKLKEDKLGLLEDISNPNTTVLAQLTYVRSIYNTALGKCATCFLARKNRQEIDNYTRSLHREHLGCYNILKSLNNNLD